MDAIISFITTAWLGLMRWNFNVFFLGLQIFIGSRILTSFTIESLQRQIQFWVVVGISTVIPAIFIPIGARYIAMTGPGIAIALLLLVAWRHRASPISRPFYSILLVLLAVISALPATLTVLLGQA